MIARSAQRRALGRAVACAIAAAACLCARPALAQETAQVSLPALVSFTVPDVGAASAGTPSPTTISFTTLLLAIHALRISVKADSDITGPGGTIPAARITWTTSNVSNGVGTNGTLSATSYGQVFQGVALATSGRIDLTWTLAAGATLHAGNYQVALRWKLEAITP